MNIYAMSDIHGCLVEFEEALSLVDLSKDNKLILLGDYIHGGPDSYGVLKRIMELEKNYGRDKVIVLTGNHEDMVLDGRWPISSTYDNENCKDYEEDYYLSWLQTLRRYYATEHQIFCHAGINEEAGDMWNLGTDDYTYIEKYPAETGHFYMDIIAGHIGTSVISENPYFHDIFYDGESHYYIDGTVLDSGIIPVIKVDIEKNKYYHVTKNGDWLITPYDEEF